MSLGAVVPDNMPVSFIPGVVVKSALCPQCGMRKEPMTADDLQDFPGSAQCERAPDMRAAVRGIEQQRDCVSHGNV